MLKRPSMLHDHLPILAFQDPSVLRAGLTRALHEHRFTRSLDPCTVHTCHSHGPFYSAMMRDSVQVTCCPSGPSVCVSNFRISTSLVWGCFGRTLVPSHLLPSMILQGWSVFRPVPLPAFSLIHHPWTAFGRSVPPVSSGRPRPRVVQIRRRPSRRVGTKIHADEHRGSTRADTRGRVSKPKPTTSGRGESYQRAEGKESCVGRKRRRR